MFEKVFCSSPWIHMRINNAGYFEPCRWASKQQTSDICRVTFPNTNIADSSIVEFFRETMSPLRTSLLEGKTPSMCSECQEMEKYNKISGREKQLLKVGISDVNFNKTFLSSPYYGAFSESNGNDGHTDQLPVDWQIDLGNYCNGGCIFCHPNSSSMLASEWKKIGLIDELPTNSWAANKNLLNEFLVIIKDTPNIEYLHFIGGETVITPEFKTILEFLIKYNKHKTITIGFTTNLTVWSDEINELLVQFKNVNLGLSIETLDSVNDYVRYPSNIAKVKQILNDWTTLGKEHNWLIQLRITPTIFTVNHLDSIYDYAWKNKIAVESCNFLNKPEMMRISVLPYLYRNQARLRLQKWIDNHKDDTITTGIVNTRDTTHLRSTLIQDAESYVELLKHTEDESYMLPELVTFIKKLELNRKNTILDYVPEYEKLLRSAGY